MYFECCYNVTDNLIDVVDYRIVSYGIKCALFTIYY